MKCRLSYDAKRLIVVGKFLDIILDKGPYDPEFEDHINALHDLVLKSDKDSILRLFDVLVDDNESANT